MSNTRSRLNNLEKNLNKKFNLGKPILPILGGFPDEPSRDLTQKEAELLKQNNLPIPISVSIDFDIQKYLSL